MSTTDFYALYMCIHISLMLGLVCFGVGYFHCLSKFKGCIRRDPKTGRYERVGV